MADILPFRAITASNFAFPAFYYRDPTPEEAQEIAESLARIRAHLLTLCNQLVSQQAALAAAEVHGRDKK